MKRKLLIDESDDNSLKKQKMSKKRNRDETVFDIIPVFKKIKINEKINEKDDIQKYAQYRRDILLYT
jgi:hypothetical protein